MGKTHIKKSVFYSLAVREVKECKEGHIFDMYIQLISYTRYTRSMETIYLSLRSQVAVSTFSMKSPVYHSNNGRGVEPPFDKGGSLCPLGPGGGLKALVDTFVKNVSFFLDSPLSG